MNVRIQTINESFKNELEEAVRAFSPYLSLSEEGATVNSDLFINEKIAETIISSEGIPTLSRSYPIDERMDPLILKRYLKRYLKRDLYDFLSSLTGVSLSYGSLTGIRPTKLYYELLSEGRGKSDLVDFFRVSPDKADLIAEIAEVQRGIIGEETDKVDWFVNIPFCPSRCHYCSFLSEVIRPKRSNLPAYVDALIRDVTCVPRTKKRRAIYIGGGTPTSLSAEQLDALLGAIGAEGEEFTVEAGRPETLTAEKLAVMRARCVTRVSVNPQTFKQETLDLIGRRHTVQDIFAAYRLVRDSGEFDVNMDLITMLPGESFEDLQHSIEVAIDLAPENITVHSLSIKRGSIFAENRYDNFSDGLAERMSDFARNALEKAGYRPYYMYRQKNTSGRLENIGYARSGKVCKYNIDIMEETHDIYASGAGAISKRIFGNGRIERLAEVKEIKGYLDRIEEMIAKKIDFFRD